MSAFDEHVPPAAVARVETLGLNLGRGDRVTFVGSYEPSGAVQLFGEVQDVVEGLDGVEVYVRVRFITRAPVRRHRGGTSDVVFRVPRADVQIIDKGRRA